MCGLILLMRTFPLHRGIYLNAKFIFSNVLHITLVFRVDHITMQQSPSPHDFSLDSGQRFLFLPLLSLSNFSNSAAVWGSTHTAMSFIHLNWWMNKLQVMSATKADGLVVSMDCKCADQHTHSPFTLPAAETDSLYRGTCSELYEESTGAWYCTCDPQIPEERK